MQAFTFGKVDVRTVCTNVDITGLVREPRSFDAYSVFPDLLPTPALVLPALPCIRVVS